MWSVMNQYASDSGRGIHLMIRTFFRHTGSFCFVKQGHPRTGENTSKKRFYDYYGNYSDSVGDDD